MRACGLRAYAGRVRAGLRAHYPSPPRVFYAGRALIAIPNRRLRSLRCVGAQSSVGEVIALLVGD